MFTRREWLTMIGLLLCSTVHAQAPVTLVDFGASSAENTFGLAGWNTVLLDDFLTYTDAGPDGTTTTPGFLTTYSFPLDEFADVQGVQGTPRAFVPGERIVVTWYNTADVPVRFVPRISFDDPDGAGRGVEGRWYGMRNIADYQEAFCTAPAQGTCQSVLNITDTGFYATAGTYSLVNVNLHIEYYNNAVKPFIVCDRIELHFDADNSPPQQVTNLQAQVLSPSSVQLTWDAAVDNAGPVGEYLIYRGDEVEGYARSTSYTVTLLEPDTEYTFRVTALDNVRNESTPSAPQTVRTGSFATDDLIDPNAFTYLGAFRVPGWAYGGDALAFFNQGNGGPGGAGAADGFSGSLFGMGIDQQQFGYINQISIPAPVISPNRDPNTLNEAVMLTPLTDVKPAQIAAWENVDLWRTGLTMVGPANGEATPRLYLSWGYHYQVDGGKNASLTRLDPMNLGMASLEGPWYVGGPPGAQREPVDAKLNDYLFTAPQDWADTNTGGRSLLIGRFRDGGLSGMGPTLFATAPWTAASLDPNTELPYTQLLEYAHGDQSIDNYVFPNATAGYKHNDNWKGATWLRSQNRDAVVFVGNKALGHTWYGYYLDYMELEWAVFNVPQPPISRQDPDKGWKSHNNIPMMLFYDPDDLAAVANGTMEPYQPQPYAAFRPDTTLFFGPDRYQRSASYDEANERLYVVEGNALQFNDAVVHVWDVSQPASGELPVEMTHFRAVVDQTDVVLHWTTATETNNLGFEIQQAPASEPDTWKSLAFVEGHGTTTAPQTYRYTITPNFGGTWHFRLKQMDHDGTASFSAPVRIEVGLPEVFTVTAPYPNPFTQRATFDLQVQRAQHVVVAVYDNLGRLIETLYRREMTQAERQSFVLHRRGWAAGTYHIRITGETFSTVQSVTLAH